MCTCPNYLIWKGEYNENHKLKLYFIGPKDYDDMLKSSVPFVQVPCGHCLDCRLAQTRQWADRCVLEAKKYKYNYFITLTYDDAHLPPHGSLRPSDVVKFIKRLRKKFKDNKIRVFYCGEYGDASLRPHYHLCVFNLPLTDVCDVFQMYNPDTQSYQNYLRPASSHQGLQYSRTIYDLWMQKGEHLGNISVGEFNYDTAAYVAQYVQKKCNAKMSKKYEELNLVPEFCRMSNRPGIGADYFYEHDDGIYSTHIIVPSPGEAHKASIPRYFDKLFIKKYGEDMFLPYQKKRLAKRLQNQNTYIHNDVDDKQQRALREYNLKKMKKIREQI